MSRLISTKPSVMTMHLIATALLLAFSGNASAKGDAVAGAAKAKPCTACHGTDGNATQDQQYPRLAGQYADYIAQALREYKSGERGNAIMKGMEAPLSEQDIDDIAAYFASQPGKLHDLSHMKK